MYILYKAEDLIARLHEVCNQTFKPISSAHGRMCKSPTVDTVALLSSNDFAACAMLVSASFIDIFVNMTYSFDLILSHLLDRLPDLVNLICLATPNQT